MLAPSKSLLESYQSKIIDWDTFAERYNLEIINNPEAIKIIYDLHQKSKTENITLLCQEKEDDPHCHRHLLKKIIDNPDFAKVLRNEGR